MMTPCKPPHQSMRPFDVNMLVFHVCRQKWLIWWRSIYSQPEDMQDMPQQEEEVWGKVGSGALVVWWCACVRYLNCHPVTFNLAGHQSQILQGFKLPNRTCSKVRLLCKWPDPGHFQKYCGPSSLQDAALVDDPNMRARYCFKLLNRTCSKVRPICKRQDFDHLQKYCRAVAYQDDPNPLCKRPAKVEDPDILQNTLWPDRPLCKTSR